MTSQPTLLLIPPLCCEPLASFWSRLVPLALCAGAPGLFVVTLCAAHALCREPLASVVALCAARAL
jgi:hypothetical protein